MKPSSILLAALCALLCTADACAAALTSLLAPDVSLELSVAGSGDGAFLASAQPVSKAQFQAFTAETGYKTEAERGTSGGFGYDAATKTAVQRPGFSWRNPGFEQAPTDPVVDVTRDDALAFLTWASRKTGRALSLPSVRRWEMAVAAHPLEKSSRPGTSVREWTTDMAASTPGQPPRVILRGASWLQDAAKPDTAQLSNAATPGSRRPDYGFRACAENTPDNVPAAADSPGNNQLIQSGSGSSTASVPGENLPDQMDVSTNKNPLVHMFSSRIASAGIVVFLTLSLLTFAAAIFLLSKIFSRKGASMKQNPPSRWGAGSQPTATATRGGIQIRASVPSGTPIRVTWANGPGGGMVVPYQPGSQGMFIPVEGTVTNPRAVPVAPEGIVPDAAVTPVDGGFRVSGSVPDGTTIHGYWTDAAGKGQTGNARYDGTNRFAFFRTQSPATRIAVSLRPLSAAANFPANPPPGARQAAPGTYSSNPSAGVHYYQDDSNFWTGFWLADVLGGGSDQPPPLYTAQGYDPFNQGIGGQTLFDDQPGNVSQPGNWLSGGEPPAYH